MSVQLKYYNTFKSLNNNTYKINIYQDTSNTITATEIQTSESPFILTYNEMSSKYDVIQTSQAEINLFSTQNQMFAGLLTADMKEYSVVLQKFVSGTTWNNIWYGYLNSEVYDEPFGELNNYNVRITANDGFNLLKRIKFVDDNGNKYTELMSVCTVIKVILNKLQPVNCIYINHSTSIDGISTSYFNHIFQAIYVNPNNYIDEDGVVMDCRSVLEEILKPFYCFITQKNGNYYITDYNYIANGGVLNFKKYDSTSLVYITNENINTSLGDLLSIGFQSDSQDRTTDAGINKQKLYYSPYQPSQELVFEPSFSNKNYQDCRYEGWDSSEYRWEEVAYWNDKSFINTGYTNTGYYMDNKNSGCSFYEAFPDGTENLSEENEFFYYLPKCYTGHTHQKVLQSKNVLPYFVGNSDYKLKIQATARAQTKKYLGKEDEEGETKIDRFILYIGIQIGRYMYDGWDLTHPQWYNVDEFGSDNFLYGLYFDEVNANKTGYRSINDEWFTCKPHYIPLQSGVNGFMTLYVYDNPIIVNLDTLYNYNILYPLHFNNITISIVDKAGNVINNNDYEYTSEMNSLFCNEGESIETIHGTAIDKSVSAKGTLLYKYNRVVYPVSGATRQSCHDYLEHLLLRSVHTNYEKCTIVHTSTIINIDNYFGVYTYNTQLAGKYLFPKGIEIDFEQNEAKIVNFEIKKDDVTIIV